MMILLKGDTWNIKSDDLQSVIFDRNKSQKWINISSRKSIDGNETSPKKKRSECLPVKP